MKEMNVPFQTTISDPPVSLPEHPTEEYPYSKSLDILIGGAAGTGIKTLENLLSDIFRRSGYFVFTTSEYMSRVRGGSNTTLLRIGNRPIHAPCWHIDIFIALDEDALSHAKERFTEQTIVFSDESIMDEQINITPIPLLQTIKKLGNGPYGNSYVAGILFGMLELDPAVLGESIFTFIEEEYQKENEAVMLEGISFGKSLTNLPLPKPPKPTSSLTDTMYLIDGSSAVGFGFLTGGCNMITAYPMSPSTGVLNFMASMSQHFTLLVEQGEDEIASLNMILGGWFGGARAMTSTSGGGFSLLSEAISLSGMSETPAVIYLAQRPGPATGLPTRSEQGDLNLAIYSGHGYFGRIILAPGNLQECIDYAYLAFELADRYQMPVILLSDQYLADTMGLIQRVNFSDYEQRRYIHTTSASYNRYGFSEKGITARGIPGLGEGIVVSTSDEHDERGQITESHQMRDKMVEKRKQKIEFVLSEAYAPEVLGDGSIAIIGWGSTKGAITEALKNLDDPRLLQVHFVWLHPLNPNTLDILRETKTNIIIENNVRGDFANILESKGIPIAHRFLQSNGFAFFADLLKEQLLKVLKEIK